MTIKADEMGPFGALSPVHVLEEQLLLQANYTQLCKGKDTPVPVLSSDEGTSQR